MCGGVYMVKVYVGVVCLCSPVSRWRTVIFVYVAPFETALVPHWLMRSMGLSSVGETRRMRGTRPSNAYPLWLAPSCWWLLQVRTGLPSSQGAGVTTRRREMCNRVCGSCVCRDCISNMSVSRNIGLCGAVHACYVLVGVV